jgi:hypothetical protein
VQFTERQLTVKVQRDEEVISGPFDAARFGHVGTLAS